MELLFHGANCITITTKNARLTIDDNLADLGGKSVQKAGDIVLFTAAHADPTQETRVLIDQPGEYEVAGVSVYGIPARAHIDEVGSTTATMYKLLIDDLKILVTGHIYPELSEQQLEAIGMVDIMLVPVGGNGYTLDGVGALSLIKKVEPKLVIPTHYDAKGLNFAVPQATLEDALKALAMEVTETVPRFKPKVTDLGDSTRLLVVEQS